MERINEVRRALVRLPGDATIYGDETFIVVAFDEVAGMVEATLLHSKCRHQRFLAQYEVFHLLCDGRAARTVDETVLVEGRPITPERYLRLWRAAFDQALSPAAFEASHGLKLVVLLEGPLAPLRGAAAPWTSSPFRTFEDFFERHRRRIEVLDGGRFRVELDLGRSQGARDAYYGSSFLSSARGDRDAWSTTHVIRGVTRATQTELFDALEA